MVGWLKFFSGSFFLNRFAMEGAHRRIWNAVCAFFVGWILIYAGLVVGWNGSFATHYDNCASLKATMHRIFEDERLTVTANDYRIYSYINGEEMPLVINTFSGADSAKYAENGYNVLFDTRNGQTTYDDFSVKCTNKNENKTITYDEYSELSASAKETYNVTAEYSGRAVDVAAHIGEYEQYLNRACDETDEAFNAEIKNSYLNLKEQELGVNDYQNSCYELFVKAKYPEIVGKDRNGTVPMLRTWYSNNVFRNSEQNNYIVILDDMIVGDFVTDSGIHVNFNGYYMKMDGFTADANNADEFIIKSFKGGLGLNINVYFINYLTITPLFLLIPVALALIVFIVSKIAKAGILNRFGETLKCISSFIIVASLLTFAFIIIASFLLPKETVYAFTLLVFFLIMLVRTLAFAVPEIIKDKKLDYNIV